MYLVSYLIYDVNISQGTFEDYLLIGFKKS